MLLSVRERDPTSRKIPDKMLCAIHEVADCLRGSSFMPPRTYSKTSDQSMLTRRLKWVKVIWMWFFSPFAVPWLIKGAPVQNEPLRIRPLRMRRAAHWQRGRCLCKWHLVKSSSERGLWAIVAESIKTCRSGFSKGPFAFMFFIM